MIAAVVMLAGAGGVWVAAGWAVGALGLPFAALLQQAVVFVVALTLIERAVARFAPSGDSHG